jgi:hypothetical protein
MIIDYSKRFTLKWDRELAVGQEVSIRAAAADQAADIDQGTPVTTTVKNCRLFK